MEMQSIEELLKEPIELLKKEAEEFNSFVDKVRRMREMQKSDWRRYAYETYLKDTENEVDEFLAEQRKG